MLLKIMSKINSIKAMKSGLAEAVDKRDWVQALKFMNRLKGIVLDSLVQNDPQAIQLVGHTLQETGEKTELIEKLDLVPDAACIAWQLRADVVTTALAARIRPLQLNLNLAEDQQLKFYDQLLSLLQKSNKPLTDKEIEDRTGESLVVVLYTLGQLEKNEKITRWLGLQGEKLNVIKPHPEIKLLNAHTKARKASSVISPMIFNSKSDGNNCNDLFLNTKIKNKKTTASISFTDPKDVNVFLHEDENNFIKIISPDENHNNNFNLINPLHSKLNYNTQKNKNWAQ